MHLDFHIWPTIFASKLPIHRRAVGRFVSEYHTPLARQVEFAWKMRFDKSRHVVTVTTQMKSGYNRKVGQTEGNYLYLVH
jgi:hypothetical protein